MGTITESQELSAIQTIESLTDPHSLHSDISSVDVVFSYLDTKLCYLLLLLHRSGCCSVISRSIRSSQIIEEAERSL